MKITGSLIKFYAAATVRSAVLFQSLSIITVCFIAPWYNPWYNYYDSVRHNKINSNSLSRKYDDNKYFQKQYGSRRFHFQQWTSYYYSPVKIIPYTKPGTGAIKPWNPPPPPPPAPPPKEVKGQRKFVDHFCKYVFTCVNIILGGT